MEDNYKEYNTEDNIRVITAMTQKTQIPLRMKWDCVPESSET